MLTLLKLRGASGAKAKISEKGSDGYESPLVDKAITLTINFFPSSTVSSTSGIDNVHYVESESVATQFVATKVSALVKISTLYPIIVDALFKSGLDQVTKTFW